MGPCSTTATVAHCTLRGGSSTRTKPRLSELGSVWLPLPHLLLLPFVQIYSWWANGLAGVVPSALAYLAGCAGVYRLARHWLRPAPAALALAFLRCIQPALLADHGHDRTAVCLRDDLGCGLAGGVAASLDSRPNSRQNSGLDSRLDSGSKSSPNSGLVPTRIQAQIPALIQIRAAPACAQAQGKLSVRSGGLPWRWWPRFLPATTAG